MRVEKASFGHLVLLMPEEQKYSSANETIERLKKTGKVVTFISGCESTKDVFCDLIKSSMQNK